jgi:pre-mRNA-splicing factor SYF1
MAAILCAVLLLLLLQILTYTEAVKTVDHDKAVGKPNSLWIAFAKFYEGHGDIDNARIIFNKAVQVRAAA